MKIKKIRLQKGGLYLSKLTIISTFLKKHNSKAVALFWLLCISLVAIIIGTAFGLGRKIYKEVTVVCNNTSKSVLQKANPRGMTNTEFVGTNRHGLYMSNYVQSNINNPKSFKFRSLQNIYTANPPNKNAAEKWTLTKLNYANITAISDYVTVSTQKNITTTNNEIFVGTKNNGLFSVSMQTKGNSNYSITNIAQITNNLKTEENVTVSDSSQIVSLNILHLDTPTNNLAGGVNLTNVNTSTNLLIQTYDKSDINHYGGLYRYRLTDTNNTKLGFINRNYVADKNISGQDIQMTNVSLQVAYKKTIFDKSVRDYSNIILAANHFLTNKTLIDNVLLNLFNNETDDLANKDLTFQPFGLHQYYTDSNKAMANSDNKKTQKILTISKQICVNTQIDKVSNDRNLGFSVGFENQGLYTSYGNIGAESNPYLTLQNIDNIIPPTKNNYGFNDRGQIYSLSSKYTFDDSYETTISSILIAVIYGNNFGYVVINNDNGNNFYRSHPTLKQKTLNIKCRANTFQILNWSKAINTTLGFLGTKKGLKLVFAKANSTKNDYSIISQNIILQ